MKKAKKIERSSNSPKSKILAKAKKSAEKKKHYTKVCPKCGSPDINIDKTNPLQPAMGLPARYVCGKCSYSGRNFPEVDISKLKKIKAEGDGKRVKSELVDTAYGKLMVKKVWKLYGVIVLILGIIIVSFNKTVGGLLFLIGLFLIFFKPMEKKYKK